jgi:hypothetical protein
VSEAGAELTAFAGPKWVPYAVGAAGFEAILIVVPRGKKCGVNGSKVE